MYPAFDVRNLYYMCSVVTGRSRCPKTSLFSPSVSSQIRVACMAVAAGLHSERYCARENVSVRDIPVSEEM